MSERLVTALRAHVKELEAWAKEWHEAAETICLLAGVSQGLGADEMVVAFRDTNDALHARVAKLEAALRFLFEETKWNSVDKDNMEFDGRVTCYQLDRARAALKGAPQ